MENPFKQDPLVRRAGEASVRLEKRAAQERAIEETKAQIQALSHYIEQGETRPGDAEHLESLQAKLSQQKAKLQKLGL